MTEKLKVELFHLLETNPTMLGYLVKRKKVKKGTLLIQEGRYAYVAFFIINGISRSYLIRNEEETTLQFNFRYDIVFPLNSYNKNLRSDEYIQALTDLEYVKLDLSEFDALKQTNPEFHLIESKINELYIFQLAKRLRNFQLLNAKERYVQLLESEPQIVKYCSLSHIASYLGIKLGSLSRIRKELRN